MHYVIQSCILYRIWYLYEYLSIQKPGFLIQRKHYLISYTTVCLRNQFHWLFSMKYITRKKCFRLFLFHVFVSVCVMYMCVFAIKEKSIFLLSHALDSIFQIAQYNRLDILYINSYIRLVNGYVQKCCFLEFPFSFQFSLEAKSEVAVTVAMANITDQKFFF